MFDSPMTQCPVCGQMVVLDQTKAECGRKHACSADTECPLLNYFTVPGAESAQPKKDRPLPK